MFDYTIIYLDEDMRDLSHSVSKVFEDPECYVSIGNASRMDSLRIAIITVDIMSLKVTMIGGKHHVERWNELKTDEEKNDQVWSWLLNKLSPALFKLLIENTRKMAMEDGKNLLRKEFVKLMKLY